MIKLCLDYEKFKSKPCDYEPAKISKRLASQEVEIDFKGFLEAIGSGQTYSPSTYIEPVRKARNFKQSSIFCADIDDSNYTFEEVLEASFFKGYEPSIIHESFSSTPEKRKWRVIYISREPETCPYRVKRILADIRDNLDGDPAIVDTARMIYSTTKDKLHYAKLSLNDFEVSESQVQSDIANKKDVKSLPEEVGARAIARHRKHRVKAEKFFYNRTQSRRQRIFHTVVHLCFTGDFTESSIRKLIVAFVNDNVDEFCDYDKDIDKIVDSALEWYDQLA